MTRRWIWGAVSLFITGCLNPPPRVETPAAPPASQVVAPSGVETPGAPAASQEVAPSGAAGAENTPKANGVKFLPPQMGAMQKISGAEPQFPAELRVSGRTYVVTAKICVSSAGVVDSVSILAGSAPALAPSVLNAVTEWRYTPLMVNGGAVPFCYPTRFEFKTL